MAAGLRRRLVMYLDDLASLPEFVQSHPGMILGGEQTGTFLGCERQLRGELKFFGTAPS